MAERLTGWPERPNSDPIYPWDDWTDGSIWKAVHGEDFACQPTTFAGMLRRYANRHNLKVQVQSKPSQAEGVAWIAFRFTRKPGRPPAEPG